MPKPKTGKAVPPTAPKKPGDVNLVKEVKAGAITAAKATAAKKVTPAKFSPLKFKPNPPSPKIPPPEKKSDKPCGIGELFIVEKDPVSGKIRKPGIGRILQVVPRPAGNETISQSGVGPIEIERSKGGDRKLDAEVKSKEGGRKQACMLRKDTVSESNWKDGATQSFTVKAPSNDDMWPSDADPDLYYIFGRGCDERYMRYLIEVFPSQSNKVTLKIDELKNLIKGISGGIGGLVHYFLPTPGSMTDEELQEAIEDEQFDEGQIAKVEKFKGKVEIAWGWKEDDKDWRTYYSVEISAGLDPLYSIAIKPKFSLAKVAYSAAGLPPGLSDFAAKFIADIYVQLELAFESKLMGNAKFHYYTYDDNGHSGTVECKGTGKFGLVLGARVGCSLIVAVIIEGAARSAISIGGEIEVNHDGVFLQPKVEVSPVTFSVIVRVKAFLREKYKRERTWELGGPWEIYPRETSTPFELWPRNKKKGLAKSK